MLRGGLTGSVFALDSTTLNADLTGSYGVDVTPSPGFLNFVCCAYPRDADATARRFATTNWMEACGPGLTRDTVWRQAVGHLVVIALGKEEQESQMRRQHREW